MTLIYHTIHQNTNAGNAREKSGSTDFDAPRFMDDFGNSQKNVWVQLRHNELARGNWDKKKFVFKNRKSTAKTKIFF